MSSAVPFFSLVLLISSAPAAEPAPVAPAPFVLRPAAAPSPALKYTLLPELREQTPANAAERYRRAVQMVKRDAPPGREWSASVEKWMHAPLSDLPRAEVREVLKPFEATLDELEAGARCEQCDWELTDRIRKSDIDSIVPMEVQQARTLGEILALRARLELAEGRPDKAVGSLQAGFALARRLAEAPTVMSAFVGLSVADRMTDRLEELIQQPDAPNLYWALTDLPQPFIDLRRPLQGERVFAYAHFPGMAEVVTDPNAGSLDGEQLRKLEEGLLSLFDEEDEATRPKNKEDVLRRLEERHESAMKLLISGGRPKEKVEAMPRVQVALVVAFQHYDRVLDEAMKCQNLPPWQARPLLDEARKRQKEWQQAKDGPALPFAGRLIPVIASVFNTRGRLDRRLAILRCVEGVRLYAAAHGGALPATLSEVKEVPIPTDPLTGKDFTYTRTGDMAVLSSVPSPNQQPDAKNSPAFELLLKK